MIWLLWFESRTSQIYSMVDPPNIGTSKEKQIMKFVLYQKTLNYSKMVNPGTQTVLISVKIVSFFCQIIQK